MTIQTLRIMPLAALTALLMAAPSQAVDASNKGFEVAARSDRTDLGFGDSKVAFEMVLTNAAGDSTTREVSITTLEKESEEVGDRSLVLFSRPRDIRGTGLLSHAKILDPDDQWLYLPALKRVKRISSANKSGPFVGSEFAFEDITGQELNKYEYTWLREEPCGDLNCDVVERRPRYENSGYTRQLAWYDQTDFQIRKIEYYDRKSALLKTQHFEEYKLYDGQFWRSLLFRMENHQTGKKTNLVFSDYTFGVGLEERDFVKSVLTRQR
ncbi:MAG: outer membrane lipoprotein-sorting protein [Pseudomonadota bacterium]